MGLRIDTEIKDSNDPVCCIFMGPNATSQGSKAVLRDHVAACLIGILASWFVTIPAKLGRISSPTLNIPKPPEFFHCPVDPGMLYLI